MYLEIQALHTKVKRTRLQKGDRIWFDKTTNCFSGSRGDNRLLFTHTDNKLPIYKDAMKIAVTIMEAVTGRTFQVIPSQSKQLVHFKII